MSKSLPDGRKARLEHIQTLRALGALMVVVSHALGDVLALYPASGFKDWLPGTFGVEVFFFVSGFIICLTSTERFGAPNATGQFYWQRFWRLVPLYWIATLLYMAITIGAPGSTNREIVSVGYAIGSLLFFPVVNALGSMSPAYALGWSLNFEMFFYICFGALLRFSMIRAVAILSVAFLLFALVHPWLPVNTPLWFWSRGYLVEFLAGLWAAIAARRIGWRLPHWVFWPGVAVLIGLTALYFAPLGGAYALSPQTAALGIAMGLLGVFCAPPPRSGLVTRAFGHIGDASYSLYLVHMFTVRALHIVIAKTGLAHHIPALATWLLFVLASVAVALVTYRVIEKPAVRLGRLVGPSRKPAVAAG